MTDRSKRSQRMKLPPVVAKAVHDLEQDKHLLSDRGNYSLMVLRMYVDQRLEDDAA